MKKMLVILDWIWFVLTVLMTWLILELNVGAEPTVIALQITTVIWMTTTAIKLII